MDNALDLASLADNPVAVAIIAGVIGLFLGWLLTYLFIGRGPSKSELAGKLAAVEDEYDSHKKNVDEHFKTTSELVNDLTESYVKVYKHLSEGAESLSGVVDMRNRLTLDDADQPSAANSGDNHRVIEGALAGGAVASVAGLDPAGADPEASDASDASAASDTSESTDTSDSAEATQTATPAVDDPAFTVSDEAVAETLSELEAAATPPPETADSTPNKTDKPA